MDDNRCRVTVTDRFGGRGHDFQVVDREANANGGMLVIATSIPDEREWIQWKGRTARQDRPGQFYVILNEGAAPFNETKHKKLAAKLRALDKPASKKVAEGAEVRSLRAQVEALVRSPSAQAGGDLYRQVQKLVDEIRQTHVQDNAMVRNALHQTLALANLVLPRAADAAEGLFAASFRLAHTTPLIHSNKSSRVAAPLIAMAEDQPKLKLPSLQTALLGAVVLQSGWQLSSAIPAWLAGSGASGPSHVRP